MKAWFDDPKELIKAAKVLQFWPTNKQSPEERVNAASRFVIYATCFLYLIRRDIRIFVLGATVLGVLYVMYKAKMIKETYGRSTFGGHGCQMPSIDNPMANVLLTDITDNPNRPPACDYSSVRPIVRSFVDDRIPYDAGRSRSPLPMYQKSAASRQFVSGPVTSIPGDQTAFAEWCYGDRHRPLCRSDTGACSPNARGAQLGAFSGLDFSGDRR